MPEKTPTFFPNPAAFRAWLEEHHATTDHLWVGYYKKASGKHSITWEESVKEALCFGWVDGVRNTWDSESYMNRFTPRKPKSVWSQRNIEFVEQLKTEGKMTPAGLTAFAHKDAHKDSGYRAAALTAELTPEMIKQFKATPGAWEFFVEQPPGYRRQSIYWVMSAKREETRQRRVSTLIKDSENGLRIKQLRKG